MDKKKLQDAMLKLQKYINNDKSYYLTCGALYFREIAEELTENQKARIRKILEKQEETSNKVNEAFNTYATTVRKNKEQS